MGGEQARCRLHLQFYVALRAATWNRSFSLARCWRSSGKRVCWRWTTIRSSLNILVRQLRSWGMLPIAVTSGADALRLLTEGESFDLAI